jgi:hypothetical protein
MYLHNITEFSLYLTENKLQLHYKDEQIGAVQENAYCLLWEPCGIYYILKGNNAEFFNVRASGTYSNHWALKV